MEQAARAVLRVATVSRAESSVDGPWWLIQAVPANFPVDNGRLLGMFRPVQGRKTMWVAALVLLWVPLMSHCRLAAVSGLEFLRCAAHVDSQTLHSGHTNPADGHHHDADRPQEDDGCCAVEELQFLARGPADDAWFVLPIADLGGYTFGFITSNEPEVPEFLGGLQGGPPPDLLPSWRFLLRASPLSRAPSFVS